MTMANAKIFIAGAVLGTIFGATVFGPIFHFLLIGLVVVAASTAALQGRRRLTAGRHENKDLNA